MARNGRALGINDRFYCTLSSASCLSAVTSVSVVERFPLWLSDHCVVRFVVEPPRKASSRRCPTWCAQHKDYQASISAKLSPTEFRFEDPWFRLLVFLLAI